MNRNTARSGGRNPHVTGSVSGRTAPVQIYAGTVASKPVVAPPPPAKPRSNTRWILVLVVGMVTIAAIIAGATIASLSATRRRQAAAAAAVQALTEVRAATARHWTDSLEALYSNLVDRAAACARRLEALRGVPADQADGSHAALLAEATRLAGLSTSLTGRLASTGVVAADVLRAAAEATTLAEASNQRGRMSRVAENLQSFREYMLTFEAHVALFERRVAAAAAARTRAAAAPPAPPDVPAVAAPPPPPPPAAPVVPPADPTAELQTAYARALTNLAFAVVAEELDRALGNAGGSLSEEQRGRLERLAAQARLLTAFSTAMVARMERAPLPRGWIAGASPVDVLSATAAHVELRGQRVPWSEVSPRQVLHLFDLTVPGAALDAPVKARALIGAAVYANAFAADDVALRYRAEALRLDPGVRAEVERSLPAIARLQSGAARSASARIREALTQARAAVETLRGGLVDVGHRGAVTARLYKGIPGDSVDALRGHPRFPDQPDERKPLDHLEFPRNVANHFGGYAAGLLFPPTSGVYRFYMLVDDAGEFWLGRGSGAGTKERILAVGSVTSRDNWRGRPDQQSAPVELEAGRAYFFEVLYHEQEYIDLCRVGWHLPGGQDIRLIDGQHIAPLPTEDVRLSGMAAKALQDAWEALDQADTQLSVANATLTEAETRAAALSSEDGSELEAAISAVTTLLRRASAEIRGIDPLLAGARPLVQQVEQARRGLQR